MKMRIKSLILCSISCLLLGCSNENGSNLGVEQTPENTYETTWSYDSQYHFHKNLDLNKTDLKDKNEHTFGEWEIRDVSTINTRDFDAYSTIKIRKCSVCDYSQVEGNELKKNDYLDDFNMFDVLPELSFVTNQGNSFATDPTDKTDKPEVSGTYTLTNCPDEFKFETVEGMMKVRGNQTARFSKKGFRVKFEKKRNLLGLNEGKKYKKWVLLAEAKDSSLLRNSLALYMAKHIFGEEVFVTDFVPVSLFINNEYWGVYILAEQKEVKDGRVNLPEVEEDYEGTDIGYCFELDNYASREEAKGDDGDPTFTVQYKPKEVTYRMEWGANQTIQHDYTMLSDITNEDTQLPFIKNQVELLYTVLYNAAINKKAKCIENGEIKDAINIDIVENLSNYFNIDSFVDAYIFNEVCCNPDVGYSSFYMSFDNSPTGDKKLRFDVPWDFDSSFGIRKNFMENAKNLYLNNSSNMWFNLLSKLDFFTNKVKAKWEKIRNEYVFENALHMLETYSNQYKNDYEKNFTRWPQCIGSRSDAKSELTNGYLNVKNQNEALNLLTSWFKKRINYLETQFGTGRANIQ